MKFKFCGDLDCPDWVLAEISNLAKVSSVKLKLICTRALKMMSLDDSFDSEKVQKHLSDAKLDSEEDVQGILAAILFLLKGAVSNNVLNEDFVSEMQQLGLPKEHSTVLGRAQTAGFEQIRAVLKGRSLRVNRLVDCEATPDFFLKESQEVFEWGNTCIKCETVTVELNIADEEVLNRDRKSEKVVFSIDKEELKLLIHELTIAQGIVNRISPIS